MFTLVHSENRFLARAHVPAPPPDLCVPTTVPDNREKTESSSKPAVKMATNRSSSELLQRIFWFSILALGK